MITRATNVPHVSSYHVVRGDLVRLPRSVVRPPFRDGERLQGQWPSTRGALSRSPQLPGSPPVCFRCLPCHPPQRCAKHSIVTGTAWAASQFNRSFPPSGSNPGGRPPFFTVSPTTNAPFDATPLNVFGWGRK